MIALAAIEWNWGEAILNESGRDLVNIVGFGLTFLGLAFAWVQLRKTQSAARAAREAAERTLQESQASFRKFAVALSHRYINETKIHVQNSAWENAAVRLDDVADQIAQLIGQDKQWKEIFEELREWSGLCRRLSLGELKRFSKQPWLAFHVRLETKLAALLGPFPLSDEGESK